MTTYTVTAAYPDGRTVIRRGLTEKAAYGLCADYRTWGFRNITIAAETNEADLANRHAWQVVIFAACILGLACLFCWGLLRVLFINFLLG